MKQIQGTALLVTITEDLSNEPVLKVWALDKLEKKTGIPRCQSTLTIQNGRKQFPISAFAALEDLSQLAIGFANGAVTVIRGDLIHDRGARQRTVFESEEPITGIEFREGNITTLYIATTGRIVTLVISGRGQGQPARSLDETGCGVGCMAVDKVSRDVVVGRTDAVYYYGLHGRGPPYAYEGEKQMISIYKDYVAIVSPSRSSAIPRVNPLKSFSIVASDDAFNTSTFTLLNTELRFVAHQEQISSQIKAILSEWGDLFVLTVDGKVGSHFPLYSGFANNHLDFQIPRETFCTEAGYIISTKSIRVGHQSCTKSRLRFFTAEYYLTEVWRLLIPETGLRHCYATVS